MKRILITGGAGFIGSHFVDWLLMNHDVEEIAVYDNLSSAANYRTPKVRVGYHLFDIDNMQALKAAMWGSDLVIHLASNPDIARAVRQPSIDFTQGTALMNNVLEAMRLTSTKQLVYFSGSGVYGECGSAPIAEWDTRFKPISTYAASKMACEAMIHAYEHMFGIEAIIMRPANIVGPRQTHGVAYDFIRKLRENPNELAILGDGTQRKSYIYINDVINAVMILLRTGKRGVFNIATRDSMTVKAIADMVSLRMGRGGCKHVFSGGSRGWKGDVPTIQLDCTALRSCGWRPIYTSSQAMSAAIDAMIKET
jgi:UDP-glucose 4-epimerase